MSAAEIKFDFSQFKKVYAEVLQLAETAQAKAGTTTEAIAA